MYKGQIDNHEHWSGYISVMSVIQMGGASHLSWSLCKCLKRKPTGEKHTCAKPYEEQIGGVLSYLSEVSQVGRWNSTCRCTPLRSDASDAKPPKTNNLAHSPQASSQRIAGSARFATHSSESLREHHGNMERSSSLSYPTTPRSREFIPSFIAHITSERFETVKVYQAPT